MPDRRSREGESRLHPSFRAPLVHLGALELEDVHQKLLMVVDAREVSPEGVDAKPDAKGLQTLNGTDNASSLKNRDRHRDSACQAAHGHQSHPARRPTRHASDFTGTRLRDSVVPFNRKERRDERWTTN
ncbi:MAG: hypothetical protein H7305_15255 [Gemmatimonadaceae bacterium]|nr:hypothetical protein [Gemmatimonadaceae bacterium]